MVSGQEGKSKDRVIGADCIVIEVSRSRGNLFDKRARYSPRSMALMVEVTGEWLEGNVKWRGRGGPTLKRSNLVGDHSWKKGLRRLPVRYLRVGFFLPTTSSTSLSFSQAEREILLEPHEYLFPHNALYQYTSAPMQRFLKAMSPDRQVFSNRDYWRIAKTSWTN